MAEGIIKFTVDRHRSGPPLADADYKGLDEYRSRLWHLGLIGHDSLAGVGYGNISQRGQVGFVISGTQTGYKEFLDGGDYVVVDAWDFARNSVSCAGPCLPSSEALSHAALYRRPDIGAVIHVHSRLLWEALIEAGAMSTGEDIAYGSEALYRKLAELAGVYMPPGAATDLAAGGVASPGGDGVTDSGQDPDSGPMAPALPLVIVTRGHQDGVFAAGRTLAEAFDAITGLLEYEQV